MPLPHVVEALATQLAPLQVPAASGSALRAAVLIALHETADGLGIVFVEKSAHVRTHAGQVAFPGGMCEQADADPVQTALREAHEETGIAPSGVLPLGVVPTRPDHLARRTFEVVPVVAWWTGGDVLASGDPGEIVAVHDLDVDDLLDPANRLTWVHPRGVTGPGFVVGDLFIWGLTAALLDTMFDVAGWTAPWDAIRRAAVPPRFLREPG